MSVSIMENIRAQIRISCVPDPKQCWCRGWGWVYTDWDSHHKCPIHYDGQPHPEWGEPEEWDRWESWHGDEQFLVLASDMTETELLEEGWRYHVVNWDDIPF